MDFGADILNRLINHDLVLDITIMGGDCDYTVQLALVDNDSLFGRGTSLLRAIKDVNLKFEFKRNGYRN